jgi:hypothetical protein
VKDLGEKCHANPPKSHYISLIFKSFNLLHVLEKGSALLACGGQVKAFTVYRFSVQYAQMGILIASTLQEYDVAADPNITPKERMEKQRRQLKKRLSK